MHTLVEELYPVIQRQSLFIVSSRDRNYFFKLPFLVALFKQHVRILYLHETNPHDTRRYGLHIVDDTAVFG